MRIASPSQRGVPHEVKPNHQGRRGVIRALDHGRNLLTHAVHASTIDAGLAELLHGDETDFQIRFGRTLSCI